MRQTSSAPWLDVLNQQLLGCHMSVVTEGKTTSGPLDSTFAPSHMAHIDINPTNRTFPIMLFSEKYYTSTEYVDICESPRTVLMILDTDSSGCS